ncbi:MULTISPECIES: adenine phosphoribosyltransferase [Campylobacter]|uniref:adenine phosphoribosyltransferase n=1 Tax=Campylobacter TaxID=194 RepID=UPI000A34FCDD|nr:MULTISPECIES: adenine phosphoribosyltransferase [Campylobacter]MBE6429781.1 adenine phosphoribosyltransferase [Campylobacter sp.]MBO5063926.1 adenine phosphoribosyltransferase [Campylobacter sp.]MBQ3167784.1 adenine phosphoribosyltransferase [Campylobacter sp.]MDL0105053.1 adenine phosphoribosyltransferase [Campylobacter ovis]MDL0107442.1 adenine phosphoribosyltransferase [Campylobacter ovis]
MKILSLAQKEYLNSIIREVADFPKPGILFKDITTLLGDAKAFEFLMEHLYDRYKDKNLDYIVGIESRGFIFGATLANKLGVGFVPARKPNKLPYTTISQKYSLEYGIDELQMHIDAFGSKPGANVLLIDDLIATGGTAKAACEMISKLGANLIELAFIIDIGIGGIKELESYGPIYVVLGD